MINSFFGTLKVAWYRLEKHDGVAALEMGVRDYIPHYYKHKQIKLGLQAPDPVEYRLKNTA